MYILDTKEELLFDILTSHQDLYFLNDSFQAMLFLLI